MNNAVSGKAKGNVRKHRDIKLVATEEKKHYIVSEPSFYATNFSQKSYWQ